MTGFTGASGGGTGRVKLTFTVPPPVRADGVCGSASNPAGEPVTTAPAANLCSSGTASSVTTENARYTWTCSGIAGGANAPNICMAPRGYTVSVSSGGNGTISPTSRVVRYNEQAAFQLTPASGYRANSVSGTCGGSVVGDNYLSREITQNCSATIGFAEVVTQSNILTQKTGVTATVQVVGCTGVSNVAFSAAPTQGQPANTSFPFGLLGFTATTCGNGGSADVSVTYSEALPSGAKFYKLIGGTYQEYNHTGQATVISGNTVQFRVTDGGQGDADGATNGSIQDPAGVGVQGGASATNAVSIPTLSEWAMIILSGLLALGTLGVMRRRQI